MCGLYVDSAPEACDEGGTAQGRHPMHGRHPMLVSAPGWPGAPVNSAEGMSDHRHVMEAKREHPLGTCACYESRVRQHWVGFHFLGGRWSVEPAGGVRPCQGGAIAGQDERKLSKTTCAASLQLQSQSPAAPLLFPPAYLTRLGTWKHRLYVAVSAGVLSRAAFASVACWLAGNPSPCSAAFVPTGKRLAA